MQYLQFIAARADTGAVLPLARVTVYLTGTVNKAALFDVADAPVENPITATVTGLAGFSVADGSYDIEVVSADGAYTAPVISRQVMFDPISILASVTAARDAAAISADQAAEEALSIGIWDNSAATVVPRGVTTLLKTAGGSTGTNGIGLIGTFTGGGGAGAMFKFDVVANTLDRIYDVEGGYGYTSTPTPVFSASAGLAGATATVTIGSLVPSGRNYWVVQTDNASMRLYKNNAGSPQALAIYRAYSPTVLCTAVASTADLWNLTNVAGFGLVSATQTLKFIAPAGASNSGGALNITHPSINAGAQTRVYLPAGANYVAGGLINPPRFTVIAGCVVELGLRAIGGPLELLTPDFQQQIARVECRITTPVTSSRLVFTILHAGWKQPGTGDMRDVYFQGLASSVKSLSGGATITVVTAEGVTIVPETPLNDYDGASAVPAGAWAVDDPIVARRQVNGFGTGNSNYKLIKSQDLITNPVVNLSKSLTCDVPIRSSKPLILRRLTTTNWLVSVAAIAYDNPDDVFDQDTHHVMIEDVGEEMSLDITLPNARAYSIRSEFADIGGRRYNYGALSSPQLGNAAAAGESPSQSQPVITVGLLSDSLSDTFSTGPNVGKTKQYLAGIDHGLVRLVPGMASITVEKTDDYGATWTTTADLNTKPVGLIQYGRKATFSALYDLFRLTQTGTDRIGQVLYEQVVDKDGLKPRVVYKVGRTLAYTNGAIQPPEGTVLTGATSGATAKVVVVPTTDITGTWGAGTQAGSMYVEAATGTFVAAENLVNGATVYAKAGGAVGPAISGQNGYSNMMTGLVVNRAKLIGQPAYDIGKIGRAGSYSLMTSNALCEGATVTGATSGATALVVSLPNSTQFPVTGTVGAGTQAGTIFLRDVLGTFVANEDLRVSGVVRAKLTAIPSALHTYAGDNGFYPTSASTGRAYAGWNGASRVALYSTSAPTILWENIYYNAGGIEAASPATPPGDFSLCSTTQINVQVRQSGLRKIYCNWCSGTTSRQWEGIFEVKGLRRFRVGVAL